MVRLVPALITGALILGCSQGADGGGDGAAGGKSGSDGAGGERGTGAERGPVKGVDLLFVVDDSGIVADEQKRLVDEFPRMMKILTSGDLNPDDGVQPGKDFTPITDMHLGVVSADMGLPGIQMSPTSGPECDGFGDDGVLRHSAEQSTGDFGLELGLSCLGADESGAYPPYLTFRPGDDSDAVANDLACMAAMGSVGCGIDMPLESSLKALWPADPVNLSDTQKDLGITFLHENQAPHLPAPGPTLRLTCIIPRALVPFISPSRAAVSSRSPGASGKTVWFGRFVRIPSPALWIAS